MSRLRLGLLLLAFGCPAPSDGGTDVRGEPPVVDRPPFEPGPMLAAAAPLRGETALDDDDGSDARATPSPDANAEAEPPDPSLLHAAPVATAVREVFFGDTSRPRVALTFDDGPSAENTPRILAVLAAHHVRATFFVLGDRAERMPELLADIDAAGHDIGNHSYSHGSLRSMTPSQIREELDVTNAAVTRVTGYVPGLFRPPFGRYAPSSLPIVAERGMNYVLWSVDAEDWGSEADVIARRVVHDADPGDIILLHDRTSATASALPEIIRGLRAKGLEPVTVGELTGLPARARLD